MAIKEKIVDTLRRFYSTIIIFCMIIGLICGGILVHTRMQIEERQNHVENIVNYEEVLRQASFEKQSLGEEFKKLKAAGVTSMAIYDRTLEKLKDSGDIIVLNGDNTGTLLFSNMNLTGTPGKTYILAVRGKESQFQETWNALNMRLGADNVIPRQTNRGLALELSQPYNELKDYNLSISRTQAKEIIKAGFNVIVRPTNFANEQRDQIKYTFDQLEGLPNITGMVFVGKEALGYPNDLDYTMSRLKELRIPLIGIEATSQLQYEPQAGFLELAKNLDYRVGRLYTIGPDYLKKLQPNRVAQMFYISDLERNVRYNLLPLFKRGYDNNTALGSSIVYMNDLSEKLKARGMYLGRASIYPSYYPSIILLFGVLLGAIALFVFTLNHLWPLRKKKQAILFLLLFFGTIIGYVVTNGVLIRQLWALSTAILAPVNAIVICMFCWRNRILKKPTSIIRAIGEGIAFCIVACAIDFLGGIYIAAMLGSNDFFMEFNIFRGVKITFIMPLVLAFLAYIQRFPLWKSYLVNSKDKGLRFIKELLMTDVKIYTLLIVGILTIVAWIFIGRSGNSSNAPVPHFELVMRHYLESITYARPREKEFLIGYPALMLSVYTFLRRGSVKLHFIFTMGAVIGLGSMVETFAHVRTPVLMSLIRGIDGLGAGIVIGLIVICGAVIIESIYKKLRTSKESSHE